MTPWLTIIGLNEDASLSPEAARHLSAATLVAGGARHLALAGPLLRGTTLAWPSPMTGAIPTLLAHRPAPAAVLATGDPLWFGVASLLLRHVPLAETRILPAPSVFAQAAARLGWPLQHTVCLSCCGRPIEAIIPHLHPGARLLVLSADARTPAAIAALLLQQGHTASTLHVLEALGGDHERIRVATPATLPSGIDPLNLLGIEPLGAQGLPLTPGLDNAHYRHDGTISKPDIRALTLAALAPRPGELLWDVGAGSGAIGIEWMRAHPACRAVALEPRPERAALARRNAAALGVPALDVREGRAPEAFAGLPGPDAIYLGGGAHVPGLIEAAWSALAPGGRMVANAVALPTELALVAARSRLGGALGRIGIERLGVLGPHEAYRPALTVTQWVAAK